MMKIGKKKISVFRLIIKVIKFFVWIIHCIVGYYVLKKVVDLLFKRLVRSRKTCTRKKRMLR